MDKFLTTTTFVPRVERSAAYTQTVASFPTIINDFYNSIIDSINCGVNIKSPFGLIPSKKNRTGPNVITIKLVDTLYFAVIERTEMEKLPIRLKAQGILCCKVNE